MQNALKKAKDTKEEIERKEIEEKKKRDQKDLFSKNFAKFMANALEIKKKADEKAAQDLLEEAQRE